MTVKDVIDLIKLRSPNVSISKRDDILIKSVYLGVSELYRRFNLSIKSETIPTDKNLAVYNLKNKDVSLLLEVFSDDGRQLLSSDTVNSDCWDYKQINYKTFVLNHPFDGVVFSVYKACPTRVSELEDEIDLPDAMIDALTMYVLYLMHSTINSTGAKIGSREESTEAISYYGKFKALCAELENEGYKIPLNAESLSVYSRGFK